MLVLKEASYPGNILKFWVLTQVAENALKLSNIPSPRYFVSFEHFTSPVDCVGHRTRGKG